MNPGPRDGQLKTQPFEPLFLYVTLCRVAYPSPPLDADAALHPAFHSAVIGEDALRRRIRNEQSEFQLCSAGGPLGPRVISRVSHYKGEKLVKARRAERVCDSDGKLLGYQLLNEIPDVIIAKDSGPSSAVFSVAEREAIAGLRGESRTAAFTESKRLSRLRRGLREMDVVEAARVKLAVYQSVH